MRRIIKRTAAILTALVMGLSVSAGAAVSVGEYLHESNIDVARDTTLTNSAFWNGGGRQQEYFLSVKPNATAMPKVVYGNKLYGMSDINYIQDYMDQNGYKGVAGINADFFSMSTGLPLGIVVTDGILRCSDAGQLAVGFGEEGNAFIGKPEISITATVEGQTLPIDHLNKLRQPYGVYMLNADFSSTSRNTTDGIDVILRIKEGSFAVGGTVRAVVESKTQYDGAIAIEDDMIVLSCDMKGPVDRLDIYQPGQEVVFQISAGDERFVGCENAVGCGDKLLTNGEVESGLAGGTAPRTAFGIKADGSIVMYVNDGRQQGYSVGLSLSDVAQRLKDLGCVEAVNFDGGGSTAISTDYPGTGNLEIINRPSDGSPRKCANYLFLVNTTEATGVAEQLFLYPYDYITLPGGSVSFTPRATDGNYHMTEVPEELVYSMEDGTLGSVSADGTFTATGLGSGRVNVTAPSGASGYATVHVVSPNEMYVKNEATGRDVASLNLAPGETVDLTVDAYYNTYLMDVPDSVFQWSVTGEIGTITADGVFTASATRGATGSIRITSGEKTAEIPVELAGAPQMLETFEESNYAATAQTEHITVSEEKSTDFVRYGRQALKAYYQLPAASEGSGSFLLGLPVERSPKYLSFYLYGNGSQTELSVITKQGEQTTEVPAGEIGFWGYERVQVELPAGTTEISGFRLTNAGESVAYGTVYFDQIQALFTDAADDIPPEIHIDPLSPIIGAEMLTVTGSVSDAFEMLEKERITLTLDGVSYDFDYDPESGLLTAAVPAPQDLKMHRVSVEAKDSSGNIGRASQSYHENESGMTSFVDTGSHWAGNYAEYLYDRGVLGGEVIENFRYFYPEKNLSRAEFAKMISNYLGLELSQYSGVELPYVDVEQIPDWALPYVKAVYARGIILGKDTGSGISFDPLGNVTRAEMMTILGRTQERGYAEAELRFPDTDEIPDYAYSYVGALVSRGIISGYDDGTLQPMRPVRRGEMAKMLTMLY